MEDNLPVLHFKSILLITRIPLRPFLNSATLSPSNKVHFLCLMATNIRVFAVANESALDLLVFEPEISEFYEKYCNF
jgi:hypothetical protein